MRIGRGKSVGLLVLLAYRKQSITRREMILSWPYILVAHQKRENLFPTACWSMPEDGWSSPDHRIQKHTRRVMIWSRLCASEVHQNRDDLVPTVGSRDWPEEGWSGPGIRGWFGERWSSPDCWIQRLTRRGLIWPGAPSKKHRVLCRILYRQGDLSQDSVWWGWDILSQVLFW